MSSEVGNPFINPITNSRSREQASDNNQYELPWVKKFFVPHPDLMASQKLACQSNILIPLRVQSVGTHARYSRMSFRPLLLLAAPEEQISADRLRDQFRQQSDRMELTLNFISMPAVPTWIFATVPDVEVRQDTRIG